MTPLNRLSAGKFRSPFPVLGAALLVILLGWFAGRARADSVADWARSAGVSLDGTQKPVPTGMIRLPGIESESDAIRIRGLREAKRRGDQAAVGGLVERLGWRSHQTEVRSRANVEDVVVVVRTARLRGTPGGPDPLVYDQVLSDPAFSSIEPSIAARSDGTLYAAAVDAVAGTIDLYRSSNYGYTWEYLVSVLGTNPANPVLAVGEGNANRLVVVYENDSGGAGASIRALWIELDTLSSMSTVVYAEPFATLTTPRICVDSPEYSFWYPYVTWMRGVVGRGESFSVQFSRSLDFGDTWSSAVTLATGLISGSDQDVDFGGTQLSVVYSQVAGVDNRDVMIRRSSDFGASFDTPSAVAADSRDEYEPRVASTTSAGLTAVVFTKRYTVSNTDVEAMVTTDGSTWSLTYLPFSGVDEDAPDVAASVTGEAIHAVFQRIGEIRSSSVYPLSAWTAGRKVNEGPIDPSYAPAIEASPGRTQEAAFAWTQQTPDGSRILFDAEYPVGDYLIITADASLEPAVAGLVAWKETIGYGVTVVSVPTIYETYGSGDDAERIFAYLSDQSADVRHVLLVGDVDLLPMRMLYPSDTRPAYGSDFYYASVGTLNWDFDADDRWGEFVDDGFDPNPDLIVGRVPFNDVPSVQAFCTNVVAFEQASGSWKRDVLFAHGFMDHVENHPLDPVTDAAHVAERVVADFLVPLGWGSTTLYEKIGISTSSFLCDADLLQSNFRAELGWGQHGVTCTNAHGYPGGKAGIQWTADLNENFLRDLPEEWGYNYFSNWNNISADPASGAVCLWGCSTGLPFGDFNGFAASPLRSRYLIRTPRADLMVKEYLRHGAGTVIASTAGSDYSAGWTVPADGNQQSLNYYFFERLGAGPRRIGDAFYAASVQYAGIHGLARGLRVFNVFGDPTLSIDDIVLPPSAASGPRGFATGGGPLTSDDMSASSATGLESWSPMGVSLASTMHVAAAVDRSERGPGSQGRTSPPLVWEEAGELTGGVSVLSLERVGTDLLAGGIVSESSGNQGSIFRSTDEGVSWTRQDLSGVVSVRVLVQTASGRLLGRGNGRRLGEPGGCTTHLRR